MSGEDNTYTLKKINFGMPINFKAKDLLTATNTLQMNAVSIKAEEDRLRDYRSKNPKTASFSNIIEKSFHEVNTEKNPTKTITLSHVEGGWPEEVIRDPEPEKIAREKKGWVRTKEKQPYFQKTIASLTQAAEAIFKQNQLMDVYEEYFEGAEEEIVSDNFEAKVEMVYKDTEPYKRSVCKVVWNVPEEKEEQRKIAVAYRLDRSIDQKIPPDYAPPALVWDIDKPNAPTNRLTCGSEIVTLAFNNKHSHILGVGCANGCAGFFNLKNNKGVGFTKVELSHTEPVCEFIWMKSKNSTEFVTCSTDGSVRWWEIKEKEALILLEGYTVPVEIDCMKPLFLTHTETIEDKTITKDYGGTRIDNTSDAGATKFLLATEQGVIFVVNKKKNEGEIGQKLGLSGGNHLGPIVGMQRNPTSFKFILTVGDWTARIWTEDLKTPIYISKFHPAYLSDCLWTPRVGMFLISRSDGWINGYDLCYKLNEPSFSYKVTEAPLTTMALSLKGDKLLVGDEEGKISLVKLSESFYVPPPKDILDTKKANLSKFFENEQTREKLLTTVKKVPHKKEVNANQQEKIAKEKRERIDDITNDYYKIVDPLTGENHGEQEENGESGANEPEPEPEVKKEEEQKQDEFGAEVGDKPLNEEQPNQQDLEANKKEEEQPQQEEQPKQEEEQPKQEEEQPQQEENKEEERGDEEDAKPIEDAKPEEEKKEEGFGDEM